MTAPGSTRRRALRAGLAPSLLSLAALAPYDAPAATAADTSAATGQQPVAHAPASLDEWARGARFLAWSAAMEGRKAEALAAVQSVAQHDSGWNLSPQYAVLVRFGLWDELLALGAPQARAPGLTLGWLYGRGMALAARGQTDAAREALAQIQQLRTQLGDDSRAGGNGLRNVLDIAEPIVAARIAATAGRSEEAIAQLEKAVAAEDRLGYNEPSDWFFPARHLLGAQLLLAGRAPQAEQVYREDLRRNPANGWSLFGLAAALRAQGRSAEAARTTAEFRTAWQHADVRLTASAFWFAGADTTSCECQRTVSRDR